MHVHFNVFTTSVVTALCASKQEEKIFTFRKNLDEDEIYKLKVIHDITCCSNIQKHLLI